VIRKRRKPVTLPAQAHQGGLIWLPIAAATDEGVAIMDPTPADLDRRLAEQMERSKLRHIESLEWADEMHQLEKRRRQRYQRFRWLYWCAAGVGGMVLLLGSVAWGIILSDLIDNQLKPKTVIVQMPPAASTEPATPRP
jgi:hypothetical protein